MTETVLPMREHSASSTLGLGLPVLVAAVFWDVNVSSLPWLDVVGIERSEAGEVAIALAGPPMAQ